MPYPTIYDANKPSRRRFLRHAGRYATAVSTLPLSQTLAAPPALVVLAASDLSRALPKIIGPFASQTGQPVRLVMGSSGHFTRQIREGLPFDLFCSADSHLIDQLALEGKVTGKAQVMAIGRLALVSRTDLLSVTNEALTSTTLAARLTKSRKLAIANPSHAPYGRAARETLEHMGLWDTVQSQLVQAESAAQATQFALQGAAALALVPVALVPPPDRQMSQWPLKAGALALTVQKIPASYHHPIQQGVGRSVHARAQAQRLQEYLLSPPAQLILREHGFDSVAGT